MIGGSSPIAIAAASCSQYRFISQIGVGAFASACAARALGADAPPIATVLHPSPASPAANRGWDTAARASLRACGWLP